MKVFVNKIKNIISLSKSLKNLIAKTQGRQKENIKLRNKQKSDINRWRKDEELFPNWNERTKILASFITPNSSIIEFGAGVMYLKTIVKNYKLYTPSDIVKRYKETIVCDLNKVITLDLTKYDVALFSGVFEYVYDIDKVFSQIPSNIHQILMSYACSDKVKLSREKNGWLSDYNKEDLEKIFKKYNYAITNYNEWNNQSLFNLLKEK